MGIRNCFLQEEMPCVSKKTKVVQKGDVFCFIKVFVLTCKKILTISSLCYMLTCKKGIYTYERKRN